MKNIRKFKEGDLDRLIDIWSESNMETNSFINRRYWEDNIIKMEKILLEGDIRVYEIDGKILGFIGVKDCELLGVFIDRDFRKKGISHKLLDNIKSYYNRLDLRIYRKNKSGYRFYTNNGFEVKEIIEDRENSEVVYCLQWEK